jgi:hypothetical protein
MATPQVILSTTLLLLGVIGESCWWPETSCSTGKIFINEVEGHLSTYKSLVGFVPQEVCWISLKAAFAPPVWMVLPFQCSLRFAGYHDPKPDG